MSAGLVLPKKVSDIPYISQKELAELSSTKAIDELLFVANTGFISTTRTYNPDTLTITDTDTCATSTTNTIFTRVEVATADKAKKQGIYAAIKADYNTSKATLTKGQAHALLSRLDAILKAEFDVDTAGKYIFKGFTAQSKLAVSGTGGNDALNAMDFDALYAALNQKALFTLTGTPEIDPSSGAALNPSEKALKAKELEAKIALEYKKDYTIPQQFHYGSTKALTHSGSTSLTQSPYYTPGLADDLFYEPVGNDVFNGSCAVQAVNVATKLTALESSFSATGGTRAYEKARNTQLLSTRTTMEAQRKSYAKRDQITTKLAQAQNTLMAQLKTGSGAFTKAPYVPPGAKKVPDSINDLPIAQLQALGLSEIEIASLFLTERDMTDLQTTYSTIFGGNIKYFELYISNIANGIINSKDKSIKAETRESLKQALANFLVNLKAKGFSIDDKDVWNFILKTDLGVESYDMPTNTGVDRVWLATSNVVAYMLSQGYYLEKTETGNFTVFQFTHLETLKSVYIANNANEAEIHKAAIGGQVGDAAGTHWFCVNPQLDITSASTPSTPKKKLQEYSPATAPIIPPPVLNEATLSAVHRAIVVNAMAYIISVKDKPLTAAIKLELGTFSDNLGRVLKFRNINPAKLDMNDFANSLLRLIKRTDPLSTNNALEISNLDLQAVIVSINGLCELCDPVPSEADKIAANCIKYVIQPLLTGVFRIRTHFDFKIRIAPQYVAYTYKLLKIFIASNSANKLSNEYIIASSLLEYIKGNNDI